MYENEGGRLSSPLASHIKAQACDPDWVLAHFAFIACMTTLEAECDIALSPAMSVACCHAMPTPVLAFIGDSAILLANYATFLVDPGSEVELLVNESQRAVVEKAFTVTSVDAQWQMVHCGDFQALDTGDTIQLAAEDLPSMQALADAVGMPLRYNAKNPFKQGPAFGIWDRRKLVAMGTTDVHTANFVKIGNVVTSKASERHDHIAHVAAALVKAHAAPGTNVFLVVPQRERDVRRERNSRSDLDIVAILEHLGFMRERPMFRMRCRLSED